MHVRTITGSSGQLIFIAHSPASNWKQITWFGEFYGTLVTSPVGWSGLPVCVYVRRWRDYFVPSGGVQQINGWIYTV